MGRSLKQPWAAGCRLGASGTGGARRAPAPVCAAPCRQGTQPPARGCAAGGRAACRARPGPAAGAPGRELGGQRGRHAARARLQRLRRGVQRVGRRLGRLRGGHHSNITHTHAAQSPDRHAASAGLTARRCADKSRCTHAAPALMSNRPDSTRAVQPQPPRQQRRTSGGRGARLRRRERQQRRQALRVAGRQPGGQRAHVGQQPRQRVRARARRPRARRLRAAPALGRGRRRGRVRLRARLRQRRAVTAQRRGRGECSGVRRSGAWPRSCPWPQALPAWQQPLRFARNMSCPRAPPSATCTAGARTASGGGGASGGGAAAGPAPGAPVAAAAAPAAAARASRPAASQAAMRATSCSARRSSLSASARTQTSGAVHLRPRGMRPSAPAGGAGARQGGGPPPCRLGSGLRRLRRWGAHAAPLPQAKDR